MKILRKSCKIFRTECPYCYAYLEYESKDLMFNNEVRCPCCLQNFSHSVYGEPVRESEDTE